MIAEDFYSTQSRLRQEQAELLSLLKDDSCAWPSYVEREGKGDQNSPNTLTNWNTTYI